eukprot:Phypoly_transcript_20835.p1 GENE.Phypoly_transcript_20835~~Phypoly_transcript_20835.p1  ORF type:complete len:151 (+),score=18.79 Phypoly_transcript_20835:87-539(+)
MSETEKITFEIPAYVPPNRPHIPDYTMVNATVSSNNQQVVEIEGASDVGPWKERWTGCGQGQVIGFYGLQRPPNQPIKWTVKVSHMEGDVIKPSKLSMTRFTEAGYGYIVVKAEDGDDEDYDDAVITLRYLDTSQNHFVKTPIQAICMQV